MKERKQLPIAIEEAFGAMDATIKAEEMLMHSKVIGRYLAKRKDQYLQTRYKLAMCRYYTLTKGYDKVKAVLDEVAASRMAAREPRFMGAYHFQSAKVCYKANDGVGALLHAEQGLEIFRQLGDPKWQCHCIMQIYNACVSFEMPHPHDTTELLWNVVSLCDQAGLTDEVMANLYSLACSGIATQYLIEEQYAAANEFLQIPYQKLADIGSTHAHGIRLFIGEAYYYEKRYVEALAIFTELYNHEYRQVHPSFNLHISYLLVSCHLEMGTIADNLEYYNYYIGLIQKINVPYESLKAQCVKALKAAQCSDIGAMEAALHEGRGLLEQHHMGYHMHRLYHYSASKAYELAGDFRSGWESLKLYTHYFTKDKTSLTDKKIEILKNRVEITRKEKENELLKKELELHSRELELATTFLKKKNALIDDMLTFTTMLYKKNQHQSGLFEVKKKLISIRSDDNERDKIKELLDKSNQDYIRKITTVYSAITNAEAKVCALIKTGLSNKEIASLLVTSPRTVDTHRSNIRKKMGLQLSDNLERVLRQM